MNPYVSAYIAAIIITFLFDIGHLKNEKKAGIDTKPLDVALITVISILWWTVLAVYICETISKHINKED